MRDLYNKGFNSLDFVSNVKGVFEEKAGSKSEFFLLFCDAHNKIANGKDMRKMSKYFASLAPMADKKGIATIRLTDILGAPTAENYLNWQAILSATEVLSDGKVKTILEESAKKHSLLKNKSPYLIASIYTGVEILFLAKIDKYFSHSPIFFGFSNPVIQKPIALAAGVPMFHFKSTNSGVHDCPWYVQGD